MTTKERLDALRETLTSLDDAFSGMIVMERLGIITADERQKMLAHLQTRCQEIQREIFNQG